MTTTGIDTEPTEGVGANRYAPAGTDSRSDLMGQDGGHSGDGSGPEVRLVIPASARYLRLARLTVAGLAGDLGYPVDAIEDLRIAVDELCAAIIDRASGDTKLELVYREVDGGIVVEGACVATSAAPPELHGVARELLNMLADDYSIGAVDGRRTFTLSKRSGVISP